MGGTSLHASRDQRECLYRQSRRPGVRLSAKMGIFLRFRGGSVSFEYAELSDNVVPVHAKCLLFRRWLRWSTLRRR
jgi:hypothetical protein